MLLDNYKKVDFPEYKIQSESVRVDAELTVRAWLWERKDAACCSAVCKKWGKFNSVPPMGNFCDHPKWLMAKLLWELLEFSVSLVPHWMCLFPLTIQGKSFSTENPSKKDSVVLRKIREK